MYWPSLLLISLCVACSGGGDGGTTTSNTGASNQAPSAVMGTPVATGLSVTVDASGSSDPEGDPLSCHWNFGDSGTGSGSSITYTYAFAGDYTITLTVDDGALTSSTSRIVTVTDPPAGFPEPFDSAAQYLEDIHVAPTPLGNNTTGDGSAGAPYATIGHALGQVSAGSRIRVAAGTYGAIGYVGILEGTATNPIAIVADGTVIIDAGGSGSGLQISNARYVVVDGLTFQNTGEHGLNLDDGSDYTTPAHHVVLRNLRFRDIGNGGNDDCLKMSGVDDFYITGCEFSECNRGEAIDMVGCHDGVVTGNFVHDVVFNGIQTKGGSADVLIHGNRFVDIPHRAINAGGSTGAQYFRPLSAPHEGARIQMVANTFLRTGSAPVAFVGCDTCVFANNTIVDPQNYVARILEESTHLAAGHDGFFINNLIVFTTTDINGYAYVNVGPNTLPGTYTFGWNLWLALDDPTFAGPVYRDGVPAEVNAVFVPYPPILADRAGGDYHIASGSAAQGVGRDVPRGAVADYSRAPYADPPSIGAFEVQ